jgi:hypothetical protein
MNTTVTVKKNYSIQNVLTKTIDKRQEDSATNMRLEWLGWQFAQCVLQISMPSDVEKT